MWYRLTTFIDGEIDSTMDSQNKEHLEELKARVERIGPNVHCIITADSVDGNNQAC